MAAGEYGPGHTEGQEAGGCTRNEDVIEAQCEIEGAAWVGEDVAYCEGGGSAVKTFVDFRTIGIEDGVAVGIGFLDIRGAERIADEGLGVETCAGAVEEVAEAYQEGYEDEVGLVGGKIIEACLCGDRITFVNGEVSV
jgi:hypothetical protein